MNKILSVKAGKISFCLDNDGPGRKAAEALMEKYYGLDYDMEDCPPPKLFKSEVLGAVP